MTNPKKGKGKGPISSTLKTIGGAGEYLDQQIGKVFNPKRFEVGTSALDWFKAEVAPMVPGKNLLDKLENAYGEGLVPTSHMDMILDEYHERKAKGSNPYKREWYESWAADGFNARRSGAFKNLEAAIRQQMMLNLPLGATQPEIKEAKNWFRDGWKDGADKRLTSWNPRHTFTGPQARKAAQQHVRLLEAEGKKARVEKAWGDGYEVIVENPQKPTIYQALAEKLGRTPTNAELKAEVQRIKTEAYVEAAQKGKLAHQRKRRNPEVTAADMYRSFHGRDSEAIEEFIEEERYHGNLAELGQLIELKIITRSGLDAQLSFDTSKLSDQVLLCSNEDGTQMYLVGGDQAVDLGKLKMTGDWEKDIMVLGEVHFLSYMTEKDFDGFEPIIYEHEVGLDEDARGKNKREVPRPDLVYDTLNQKLSFAGGVYCIKKPLLETSRGIEK